ncbi:MAG: M1 family peptidase, partial [Saprospiraceae bacterium]
MLDDRAQTLTGNIEIEYVNHSPDALSEIWLHLWGNAFKNRRTAFTQQKLKHSDGRFYFASDSMLGFYKKLDFQVNGEKASWKFDPRNPDIAVVTLAQPLAAGARLTLSSPFELHIPASFSRLGHVGESYQITQWYPKPAVYDQRGWHAMPYLDQGEFYSEFGNFDVTITLPENYVVGATGTLQNASEIAFLAKKEAETKEKLRLKIDPKEDPFPSSSAMQKTIRYRAERVHDFAWFADKRF